MSVSERDVTSDKQVTSEVKTEPFQNNNDSGQYKLYKDTVRAEDIYDCKTYNVPDNIDGHEWIIIDIYDNQKLLTGVYLSGLESTDSIVQVGTYDLNDNTFTELFEMSSDDALAAYNNDYFVIYKRENSSSGDMSNSFSQICLYSVQEQSEKQIMTVCEPYSSGIWNECTVLYNNSVYFNINEQEVPEILKYDITNDELTRFCENAINPFRANDSVAVWSDLCGDCQTPYIYDMTLGKLVEFSNMPLEYYSSSIKDNYGMVYTSIYDENGDPADQEVCIFEKK